MSIITKSTFQELAKVWGDHCISIFIPTHRSGQEVLEKVDPLKLKNHLSAVSSELQGREMPEADIRAVLKPAMDLLGDHKFWHHQSDGLAIFLAPGFARVFTLPLAFEAFHYIGKSFYLKPLMPMFTGDGRFFILALGSEDVNMYEGTRHSIADVIINDLVPSHPGDVVGYDHEEKHLQFRSQQEGQGNAMYHGHGGAVANKKDETMQYFRAVDRGLMTMLHDETPPMVVASQDHLFAMYQQVNTYPHLLKEHVSCNPAGLDKIHLHEKAWEVIEPWFDTTRQEKLAVTSEQLGMGKTATSIHDIVPAAIDGRIDTLFLRNRSDILGAYNPATRRVHLNGEANGSSRSLMNLAAIETFLRGGTVYLVEEEEMPHAETKANALMRY